VRGERRVQRHGASGQRERGDRQHDRERGERRTIYASVEHLLTQTARPCAGRRASAPGGPPIHAATPTYAPAYASALSPHARAAADSTLRSESRGGSASEVTPPAVRYRPRVLQPVAVGNKTLADYTHIC